MKSTITYTAEVTELVDLKDDYTIEGEKETVKAYIESTFPTADVHIENFKVFEGTEGGHE